MKLSIIIPCFNEAENIIPFQNAVLETFSDCAYDYELIFVDDGSKDATLHNLKKIHVEQKCPVKIISFSRNFGKEAGIYAGLEHANGKYISIIDADLQQHPRVVKEMVEILDKHQKYDVVAACQDRRNEGKFLRFWKRGFYRLINQLSDVSLQSNASDFRTFRKSVALSLLSMGETHRFSKGLFAWVGFETYYLSYTALPRHAGRTKWSFRKLFNYALDGIIGFSTKLLRIATYLGTFTAIASLMYLVVVVCEKLFYGIDIPGYATIIVLILFLGGIQLLCLGIMGEYIGKIFEQSKERPIYIAKEILDYQK